MTSRNVALFLQYRELGGQNRACRRSALNHRTSGELFVERQAADPVINESCELSGQCRATFLMDFSPDGRKIASTHGDHTVRVTELTTGKCMHILTGHPRTPWCLAFHPSSNEILASGCLDGEVRIWDLQGGGSEVWKVNNNMVIASLTFHPTDHVLVFAAGNSMYFWDWNQPEPFTTCQTAHEYERIRWVRFDPLGHYLYTGIANNTTVQRDRASRISVIGGDTSGPRPQRLNNMYSNLVNCFHVYRRGQGSNQPQQRARLPVTSSQQQPHRAGQVDMYSNVQDADIVAPRSPVQEEGLSLARQYAAHVTRTSPVRANSRREVNPSEAIVNVNTAASDINDPGILPGFNRPGMWSPPPQGAAEDDEIDTEEVQGASRQVISATATVGNSPTMESNYRYGSDTISASSSPELSEAVGDQGSPSAGQSSHPLRTFSGQSPGQTLRAMLEMDSGGTNSQTEEGRSQVSAVENSIAPASGSSPRQSSFDAASGSNSAVVWADTGSDRPPSEEPPQESGVSNGIYSRGTTTPRRRRLIPTFSVRRISRVSSSSPETSNDTDSVWRQRHVNRHSHQHLISASHSLPGPSCDNNCEVCRNYRRSLLSPNRPRPLLNSSLSSSHPYRRLSDRLRIRTTLSSFSMSTSVLPSVSQANSTVENHSSQGRSSYPVPSVTVIHRSPRQHQTDGTSQTMEEMVRPECADQGTDSRDLSESQPILDVTTDTVISSPQTVNTETLDQVTNLPDLRLGLSPSSQITDTVTPGSDVSSATSQDLVPHSSQPLDRGFENLRENFASITARIEREMNELDRRINALRQSFNDSLRALRQDRQRFENLELQATSDSDSQLASNPVPVSQSRQSASFGDGLRALRQYQQQSDNLEVHVSNSSDLQIARNPTPVNRSSSVQREGNSLGSVPRTSHYFTPPVITITRPLDSHPQDSRVGSGSGVIPSTITNTGTSSGAASRPVVYPRLQSSQRASVSSGRVRPQNPLELGHHPQGFVEPPSDRTEQDPSWPLLQRHYLHPHYAVSILDDTINRPHDAIQAAINRAIAGAFMGTGEPAVASNIINQTHRIQSWDFRHCVIPDISDSKCNVVVPHCKLHNDASCDIAQDGGLLATFVPSHRGFPDDNILAVYSLLPDSFAQCLFTKSFGPNAISVSISPRNQFVLVGLAAKRLSWVFTANQMVAQVYNLDDQKAGEKSMKHVADVTHTCDMDIRTHISVNSARWLPGMGQGLVYGTNRGDLHICRPGVKVVTDQAKTAESSEAVNSEGLSVRRNLMHTIDGEHRSGLPQRISIATQTVTREFLPTAGTQTDHSRQED